VTKTAPVTPHRPSENVSAIAWMVTATFIAVGTHAIIRQVGSTTMHPLQVAFFYNLFTIPIIIPLILRNGIGVLRAQRYGLLVARAILHLSSMLLLFIGLTLTPLATATALNFLAPLFAVVLAALFLGENFTLRRWVALAAGFAGMLIIIRPDPGSLNIGALVMVVSALLWGATLPIIKVLSRTESSSTITAWMALMITPLALIPAIPVWTTPGALDLAWLAAAGIFGAFAQWALTQALKTGATNVVMPIDFLRLVWGVLLGLAVFQEVPDIYAVIGGAIIFASSTWLTWRERRAGSRSGRRLD